MEGHIRQADGGLEPDKESFTIIKRHNVLCICLNNIAISNILDKFKQKLSVDNITHL